MFGLGVMTLFIGYALVYSGVANLLNGFQGPTVWQALGFKVKVAPPTNAQPNLTGQPASTNQSPTTGTAI